jgi:hypothetical protein
MYSHQWSSGNEPNRPRFPDLDDRRRRSVLNWVVAIAAVLLLLSGLVFVGFVVMFVVGMNSWGSNK